MRLATGAWFWSCSSFVTDCERQSRRSSPMPDLLVGSFASLLFAFEACFTQPSFHSFCCLSCAWILCCGRRSLTRIIQAAQLGHYKHYCSFHRFFSQARWNLDDLGHCVFHLLLPFSPSSCSAPSMTLWPASPVAISGAPACIMILYVPPKPDPSSPSAIIGWSSLCNCRFPLPRTRPGLSQSWFVCTGSETKPSSLPAVGENGKGNKPAAPVPRNIAPVRNWLWR